jgi:hypothetical protein
VTWSVALALLWIALLLPAGHVLGRALRRVDDRDAVRSPVEARLTAAPPVTLGSPSTPVPGGSGGGPDALSRHA